MTAATVSTRIVSGAAIAGGVPGNPIQTYKVPNSSEVNSVPLMTSVQIIAIQGGELSTSVCGGTLTPLPIGSGPRSRAWPEVCAASTISAITTTAQPSESQYALNRKPSTAAAVAMPVASGR